jgi:hypothetical protein
MQDAIEQRDHLMSKDYGRMTIQFWQIYPRPFFIWSQDLRILRGPKQSSPRLDEDMPSRHGSVFAQTTVFTAAIPNIAGRALSLRWHPSRSDEIRPGLSPTAKTRMTVSVNRPEAGDFGDVPPLRV